MRRSIITIVTALSLIAATANAEQLTKPKMAPDQIIVSTQNAASSDGGLWAGFALLLVIAVGLMSRGGSPGGYIPPCTGTC